MEIIVVREADGVVKKWQFRCDASLQFRLYMYKEHKDKQFVQAFCQDYVGTYPYTMKKEDVEIPEDVEAEVIEIACSKVHVIKD